MKKDMLVVLIFIVVFELVFSTIVESVIILEVYYYYFLGEVGSPLLSLSIVVEILCSTQN